MENKVLGFCAITAVLGIISAATGFAGEVTRVKTSDVHITYGKCVYPSSPTLILGIVSAMFTIITRIYMSVTFCGADCCRNDPNLTAISKLLLVISRIATVGAVIILLTATGLNSRQGGHVNSYGSIECYVVKPGIFATGAILALLSAVFGIAAYLTLTPPPQTNTYPAVALPMRANVDPEKNPTPYPSQLYPPKQY